MRTVDYLVYDVFTPSPLAGNQLGVVPDASGLSGVQMQAIARELNLAETIFFLAPETAEHSAKVRIFMPLGELPFAGHPTIGGAIAFAGLNALPPGAKVILEEGVGPVHCVVSADMMGGTSSFDAARLPAELEFVGGAEDFAAALGLSVDDLGDDRILMVSGGVPYVTIALKSLAVLARVKVDVEKWMSLDVRREGKLAAPYLHCRVGDSSFRVRMFAPWDGIPEDPATGSAAVAFAASLKANLRLADGEHAFKIEQGVEMGRPSQIELSLRVGKGLVSRVTISGQAIKFAEGRMFLPD